MKKTYTYEPRQYLYQIILPGVFFAMVAVYSFYQIATDGYSIFALAAIVACYAFWNTFVSGSNPSQVILEEDGISFVSFGRTQKYLFDDISVFLTREFRYARKLFIRVNKYNYLRGRFWVNAARFNDCDELYMNMLKLEYKTHPQSVKSRSWDSTQPNIDKTLIMPWLLHREETPGEAPAESEPEQD